MDFDAHGGTETGPPSEVILRDFVGRDGNALAEAALVECLNDSEPIVRSIASGDFGNDLFSNVHSSVQLPRESRRTNSVPDVPADQGLWQ